MTDVLRVHFLSGHSVAVYVYFRFVMACCVLHFCFVFLGSFAIFTKVLVMCIVHMTSHLVSIYKSID